MRQIKNVMRPLAIAFVLGFGAQSGQATGIPTIDGAVLGNNMQDFLSNVAEYAEEAARWAETGVQWEKEFTRWTEDMAVATTAFSVVNDLMSIANSVGTVMDAASEFKTTFESIKDKGVEGISDDLFKTARQGIYANRSAAISSSCGKRDYFQESLTSLNKDMAKYDEKVLKAKEDIGAKVEAKDSSATKAASVNIGIDLARDKESKEYKDNERLRDALVDAIKKADAECQVNLASETRKAKQQGTFGVSGRGLSIGDSSRTSGSSNDEMF